MTTHRTGRRVGATAAGCPEHLTERINMNTDPTPETDEQLALRDRIAETMARADGWEWAAANFSTLSTPATDRYRRCAEAVLAELADAAPARVVSAAPDQADLRQRIAEALIDWAYRSTDRKYWGLRRDETVRANAYSRADAVLGVLPELTGQTTDQGAEPVCICGHPNERHFEDVCQTCDCGDYLEPEGAREVIARYQAAAKPEPRVPDHTVNEAEAPTPVKQGPTAGEAGWAEQERARFERLYTRESVRADLAEARAETAARDAEIYQKRLERLSAGYTRERKRAEAMERAMESTAADALKHRGCHRDLMAQCLRAERAEAEAERLRTELRRLADEAQPTTEPEPGCTHCGKTIRRITGTLTEWWVHIPGGQALCYPWQPARSTRATPKAAAGARQDGVQQ